MSKIGELSIKIPDNVEIQANDNEVIVKGPKGILSVEKGSEVKVIQSSDLLDVHVPESDNSSVTSGLIRSNLNNAIIGVSKGYVKELEIVGVGYRVEKIGNDLKFAIGYSHPVEIKAPDGITFELNSNTSIKVVGINKQVVGQISALIRDIRRPEPYKGKGIKYVNEVIKRKQGKAAKGAA
jgi:large subunit ribosomal protein L6